MRTIITTVIAVLFSSLAWGQNLTKEIEKIDKQTKELNKSKDSLLKGLQIQKKSLEKLITELDKDKKHKGSRYYDSITIVVNNKTFFPVKKKYLKGTSVNFKIENVNFLKVKGSGVESTGTNITFNIPQNFSDLLKMDASGITDNNSSKWMNLLFPKVEQQQKIDTVFVLAYTTFIAQLFSIEKSLILENKLKNIVGDGVFVKDLSSIRKNAEREYDTIYKDKADISSKISALKQSYTALKIAYDDINKTPQKTSFTVSGELKDKDGNAFKVTDAKINQTTKNKFADEFEFAKKSIAVFDDEKKKNEIIQKAEAGVNLYERIKREDFVEYTKATQLNDDFVTLKPTLKGLDDKDIAEFGSITLKTYSRVRVNFSAGYLLSFIGNEEYDYKFDNTGSIIGVNKVTSDKITHALGGLAHVLFEGKCNFPQWGLSSGISLSTDAKINFYGGLSMAFTEKNRLVFTAGLSFVNVQRLNRHNLNADNSFSSPNHQDIKYVDRYKPALFIGVTYNLFK